MAEVQKNSPKRDNLSFLSGLKSADSESRNVPRIPSRFLSESHADVLILIKHFSTNWATDRATPSEARFAYGSTNGFANARNAILSDLVSLNS